MNPDFFIKYETDAEFRSANGLRAKTRNVTPASESMKMTDSKISTSGRRRSPELSEPLLNTRDVLAKVFPQESSRPNERWLQRREAKGGIPSHRSGGFLFFKESEVRASMTRKAGELTDDQLARFSENAVWAEATRVRTELGEAAADEFVKRLTGRRRFVSDMTTAKLVSATTDELWEQYMAISNEQGESAARDFYVKFLEGK